MSNTHSQEIAVNCHHDEIWPLSKFRPNPKNPNKHPESQLQLYAEVIRFNGWRRPIVVSRQSGLIVKGHGALQAARLLGIDGAPMEWQTYETPEMETADLLADNQLATLAEIDNRTIAPLIQQLGASGIPLESFGFDSTSFNDVLKSIGQGATVQRVKLADTFGAPPFTVLDARQGYWQERKRAWLSLGIRSAEGRLEQYSQTTTVCATDWMKKGPDEGGSIFDPVVCELCFRWFCPPGGSILDPFAGGSVRGIVAGVLGHAYVGTDLREVQVQANRQQAEALFSLPDFAGKPVPVWYQGDSENLASIVTEKSQFDFVFTCPPYGDLEVYSDDAADLSAIAARDYEAFREKYWAIIAAAVERLKPNRFAAIVVGDFRDASGFYRGFTADTVRAFEAKGLRLYNQAVLVTAVGSLALRTGRQFKASRKLGKTHQDLLVFYKGDIAELARWDVAPFTVPEIPEDGTSA